MADIKYASLTYKDKDGNTGRLASLSENDIAKTLRLITSFTKPKIAPIIPHGRIACLNEYG